MTRRKFMGLAAVGALALGGVELTPQLSRVEEENRHKVLQPKEQPTPEKWKNGDLTLTWLGHASFFINFYGTRILLDPALYEKIGITPVGDYTIGVKRYIQSPLTAQQIGPVDLLICSHAHTDHLDYPTLRKFQSDKTTILTAKNTKQLWEGMKFQSVQEIQWGQEKQVGAVKIKAIEGRHWGARLPWNKEMQANSILLSQNGVNLFFGADTGYTEAIQQQLREVNIDLAIMGIGAYSPKSFESHHATPEQAIQMADEIGAKKIIPMHWGTFKLSQEPMDEPIKRFNQAMSGRVDQIALQDIGATWTKQ